MKKILYVMLGSTSLILGALGSLIPVLPTAPVSAAGCILFCQILREAGLLVQEYQAL